MDSGLQGSFRIGHRMHSGLIQGWKTVAPEVLDDDCCFLAEPDHRTVRDGVSVRGNAPVERPYNISRTIVRKHSGSFRREGARRPSEAERGARARRGALAETPAGVPPRAPPARPSPGISATPAEHLEVSPENLESESGARKRRRPSSAGTGSRRENPAGKTERTEPSRAEREF